MQALSERVGEAICGATFDGYTLYGFSGLKTATPSPESLFGEAVSSTARRGKYLIVELSSGTRMLFHLSQGGRLDIENPPKKTKPKGSVVRLHFGNDTSLLLREFGTERKAGWWLVSPGEQGPLEVLGPEPDSAEFAELIRTSKAAKQVHNALRDQRTVAGIGRGYSDDILHRSKLSPFCTFKGLDDDQRETIISTTADVLAEALVLERKRKGGLSENKLGEHFTVHGRAGSPCPVCATELQRVSFESHEVVYCPTCQTGGKILADRRLSKLLK